MPSVPEPPKVPWVSKPPQMPCVPEPPQECCVLEHPNVPSSEDKSIYHRASRRWRKVHCANGHTFLSKQFSKCANCAVCSDRIGGFEHKAYKCMNCKLLVHKKCHALVTVQCKQQPLHGECIMPINQASMALDPKEVVVSSNPKSYVGIQEMDEDREIIARKMADLCALQVLKTLIFSEYL